MGGPDRPTPRLRDLWAALVLAWAAHVAYDVALLYGAHGSPAETLGWLVPLALAAGLLSWVRLRRRTRR